MRDIHILLPWTAGLGDFWCQFQAYIHHIGGPGWGRRRVLLIVIVIKAMCGQYIGVLHDRVVLCAHTIRFDVCVRENS